MQQPVNPILFGGEIKGQQTDEMSAIIGPSGKWFLGDSRFKRYVLSSERWSRTSSK